MYNLDPKDWNISPKQAIHYQRELGGNINLKALDKTIQRIGGADISYNKYDDLIYAGSVK